MMDSVFLLADPIPGADPVSEVGGDFSHTWYSQVSLQVHYCTRDEVYFTALL